MSQPLEETTKHFVTTNQIKKKKKFSEMSSEELLKLMNECEEYMESHPDARAKFDKKCDELCKRYNMFPSNTEKKQQQ